MRSAERKSLKFQGNTGEDSRAGGGGGGGAGLISMKMRPPLQHGCHDTLGAWRLYSCRAARVLVEGCRERCEAVSGCRSGAACRTGPSVEAGSRALPWSSNRNQEPSIATKQPSG